MLSFYGLIKPYNFHRATPFVFAALLLTFVVMTAAILTAFGLLGSGTFRSYFFFYLGLLSLAAMAFSFFPTVAWILIALCFLELSLGFASSILGRAKILPSLLPANTLPLEPSRFQFHPLLQARPVPNFARTTPFVIRHNSWGLRGAEREAENLQKKIVVATVGGSSTYDVAVPEEHTWSDDLNRDLGENYAVLNHGVPGYSSVENLIQTLFYLDSYGVRPRCAVYYIGWNDIQSAHLPTLDPGYADFHLIHQWTSLQIKRTPFLAMISPIALALFPYIQTWTQQIHVTALPDYSSRQLVSGSDARLEKIFRNNIEAMVAVNKQRGITSIFVGQLLNRAKLNGDGRYGWLPLVPDKDVWPLQEHFNALLRKTTEVLGTPSVIPPIDEFESFDFVDEGHFSEQGAEKFAKILAPVVRANCAPEQAKGNR